MPSFPDASASSASLTTQRGTQHLKCADFLIEKSTEERGKIWRVFVAGRTDDGQRFLTTLIAQPQQGRQVGHVVGMKVAYADHPQIFKFRF